MKIKGNYFSKVVYAGFENVCLLSTKEYSLAILHIVNEHPQDVNRAFTYQERLFSKIAGCLPGKSAQ